MELVQCKKDVIKTLGYDFVEVDPPRVLFKQNNFYPVFQDQYGSWLSTDEEGEAHIISEGTDELEADPWFGVYFKKL
ncbi:hypothetical protein D7Z54_25745 [Salibacterium salarium]|uniref:Uncharacterized protein n=1 Tax=Salibacterium salarium TaxID=284579 RepID=A0A3R9QH94_9BACI|nr:hypothetical protein [Salibacterium salarium]RSL30508.1 hypothetical protein D7Z54_25745 [Salibacterium salarium]